MPYREKDTSKMPTSKCNICKKKKNNNIKFLIHFFFRLNTDFENSSIKTCFSLSSLHPSTVNVEDGQQAAQRPYHSLTKKIK